MGLTKVSDLFVLLRVIRGSTRYACDRFGYARRMNVAAIRPVRIKFGIGSGGRDRTADLGVMKAPFAFCICDIESHNFNVYYNLPPLQSSLSLHPLTCFSIDSHRVT